MPPSAQQRRADTQVSRAVRDGRLEIAAHSGRNYLGQRVALADLVGDLCKLSKRRTGVGAQRRYGHHPREFETDVISDGVGNRADLVAPCAGSARSARLVEVNLDETSDRCLPRSRLMGGTAERIDEAQPVHRMNQARVADDRRALIRLQRTDEVPSQNARIRAYGGDGGDLGGGLLIAVLAHIRDAKLGKQRHV